MKKLFCLFLCLVSSAFAAITDHYVSSVGGSTYAVAISTVATSMTSNGVLAIILTDGSTTWTNFGAGSNAPGTIFTMANQPGTGTGTCAPLCTWALALAGAAAGDRVNVVNDATYTRTTTNDALTNSGTSTSPIWIRGFHAVPGDGYLGRVNSSGLLVTTNMPAFSYTTGHLTLVSETFAIVDSLNVTGAATGGADIASAANGIVQNCVVTDSYNNSGAIGIAGQTNVFIYNNDVFMTGSSAATTAITATTSGTRAIRNHILQSSSSATCVGISMQGVTLASENQIVGSGNGYGIYVSLSTSVSTMVGNTITDWTDGITVITGSTTLNLAMDNVITDYTSYAIEGTIGTNAIAAPYNRYRENTSGGTNTTDLATDWLASTSQGVVNTVLSATDYTTAFTDLRLLSTSPAVGVASPYYSSAQGKLGSFGAVQQVPGSAGEIDSAYVK